ncbi:MAG TPA: hypothetical protein VIW29_16820 [Polyangiaceae bacterium]
MGSSGISSAAPSPAQRYCYVSARSLEQLFAASGVLEGLLFELEDEDAAPAPIAEQLARLQRSAIHLSVTRSRFHGLSWEEVVVLTAYSSKLFDDVPWKRELLRQPSPEAFRATCRGWLDERASVVSHGHAIGRSRWPLVGGSPANSLHANPFVIAVAPYTEAAALERELAPLAEELGFAHEHYVACTPATALEYLARVAQSQAASRWDPFALDRRLRTFGMGLLLIEPEGVLLYLPARYHPSPSPPVAWPK